MNRSVLLRLLPRSRTGARLAGIAEVIDTGERRAFRDADDLVSLLLRLHGAPDPPGSDPEAATGGATVPSARLPS